MPPLLLEDAIGSTFPVEFHPASLKDESELNVEEPSEVPKLAEDAVGVDGPSNGLPFTGAMSAKQVSMGSPNVGQGFVGCGGGLPKKVTG
jgi:hypothetical protein